MNGVSIYARRVLEDMSIYASEFRGVCNAFTV